MTQSPDLHFRICTRSWTRCSEVFANLQIHYSVSVTSKTNVLFFLVIKRLQTHLRTSRKSR